MAFFVVGVRPALYPSPSGVVSVTAQLFALFVCMYRGLFPRVIAPSVLLAYPTYITNISIFIYNILKLFDDPVCECAVNNLHTFVLAYQSEMTFFVSISRGDLVAFCLYVNEFYVVADRYPSPDHSTSPASTSWAKISLISRERRRPRMNCWMSRGFTEVGRRRT